MGARGYNLTWKSIFLPRPEYPPGYSHFSRGDNLAYAGLYPGICWVGGILWPATPSCQRKRPTCYHVSLHASLLIREQKLVPICALRF